MALTAAVYLLLDDEVGAASSAPEYGLTYRKADASNYWHAWIDKKEKQLNLDKVVAGVRTNVAQVAVVDPAGEARVIVQGNRHRIWWNFALLIDEEDSDLNTYTKAGLAAENANGLVSIDNWYAQGLEAVPTAAGPESPAAATEQVTGGVAWTNPGNILASDDARATVTLGGFGIAKWIYASQMGFAIPSTATIQGVTVEVEAASSAVNTSLFVQLSSAPESLIGSGKSDASAETTEAYHTFGSAFDTWSATLTPTMVNDTGFGAAVRMAAPSGGADVQIDHVRITVHYKEG